MSAAGFSEAGFSLIVTAHLNTAGSAICSDGRNRLVSEHPDMMRACLWIR